MWKARLLSYFTVLMDDDTAAYVLSGVVRHTAYAFYCVMCTPDKEQVKTPTQYICPRLRLDRDHVVCDTSKRSTRQTHHSDANLIALCQVPGSGTGSRLPRTQPTAQTGMRHLIIFIVLILHHLSTPVGHILFELSNLEAGLRPGGLQSRHRRPSGQKLTGWYAVCLGKEQNR